MAGSWRASARTAFFFITSCSLPKKGKVHRDYRERPVVSAHTGVAASIPLLVPRPLGS